MKELKHFNQHFNQHFKDKIVYLNCDDLRVRNSFRGFSFSFEKLGLKKLIARYMSQEADLFSQKDSEEAIWLEYDGDKNHNMAPDPGEIGVKPLTGDSDFRGTESIELLKIGRRRGDQPAVLSFRPVHDSADEVRKIAHHCRQPNTISYRAVVELVQETSFVWATKAGDMAFKVRSYYEPRSTRLWVDDGGHKWRSFGNTCWFTNLDLSKCHGDLLLYTAYSPEDYPAYDSHDALTCRRLSTFLDKYNPDQFLLNRLANGSSASKAPAVVEEISGETQSRGERVNGVAHEDKRV